MTDVTPSYVSGASTRPLLFATIGDVLAQAARRWPAHEALVVRHQCARLTYSELDREVDRVARGLLATGLKAGDRVGIWSPNNCEWVIGQFATARAGLVLVNINPAYRADELCYALRKVGCRALIFAPRLRSSDYAAILRGLLGRNELRGGGRVASAGLPDLELLVRLGPKESDEFLSFEELSTARGPAPAADPGLDPDQPINIQFTSGTTGLPKGVTLTHFNIVNNGYFVGEAMRIRPDDRICIPVPLYHCFGMVGGVLAAATHGAAMVFPCESFDAGQVLEAVAAERCTALYGVPTMFIAELEHPTFREFDLSSLRTGIMGGSPCPIAIMRRVVEDMHMRDLTIAYGMTEMSPVSFQTDVTDPPGKRATTVGRVHPHVQAKVIDGSGRVVPRGSPGELLTRGYSVMRGYWGDASQTGEAVDAAGWMHTGDLATLDEDGYCNIVGRVKDMIICGGENVYPREIEEYLYKHAKIMDVAVVGVPDPKYGEAVCAVIRLREGEAVGPEEIIEFCRGRIAHYKVPRYVRFVASFPMTVTGKVQKYLLREQMSRELQLVAQATA